MDSRRETRTGTAKVHLMDSKMDSAMAEHSDLRRETTMGTAKVHLMDSKTD